MGTPVYTFKSERLGGKIFEVADCGDCYLVTLDGEFIAECKTRAAVSFAIQNRIQQGGK